MIDRSREVQFSGGVLIPLGITIHNTNNSFSASENYELMISSTYSYSAHFFVDSETAIQAMPTDVQAFHTGKAYDSGNKNTIAIEICSCGTKNEFDRAIENVVLVIQLLREKYGDLSIYFHNDFDIQKYCPHRILDEYGSKREFLRRWNLDKGNG